MNISIQSKSAPEVKPWVRRIVEAAGVSLPAKEKGLKEKGLTILDGF